MLIDEIEELLARAVQHCSTPDWTDRLSRVARTAGRAGPAAGRDSALENM
jgi:hypothetical protein